MFNECPVQTFEENNTITGEGLLVVDASDRNEVEAGETYLVAVSDTAVGLARGSDLIASSNTTICGKVLFCCRPPARGLENSPLGASGSQMVQV